MEVTVAKFVVVCRHLPGETGKAQKHQNNRRADRHLNFHRPITKLQGTRPKMFRRITLHVTRMVMDRSGSGQCMFLGWNLDRSGSGLCILLRWSLDRSGLGHCMLLGWNFDRSGSGHCMLLGWNFDRSGSGQCPIGDFVDIYFGLNKEGVAPCRLVVIVPTFQRILQSP
jgi:hypothetical protein